MASYTDITTDHTGRTVFLSCDDCGALVLPAARATHDRWHTSVDDLVRELFEHDALVDVPRDGRPVDLQALVERIHAKALAR